MADCDVDAADMHLLMKPEATASEDFYSGKLAVIDAELCMHCGRCEAICRFDAIHHGGTAYTVTALDCEGCGLCARICPFDAISMVEQKVGECFVSTIKTGGTMVHARLGIGAENSGKLVAKVKQEAKRIALEQNLSFVLVDGSPGIGCPVVSSLSGADFVVLVTEPTVSGLHDLIRVYELVKKFSIPAGCIINKADLNTRMSRKIEDLIETEHIVPLLQLLYDEFLTRAMVQGQTLVEYQGTALKPVIEEGWEYVKKLVQDA